jgi:molecular chaperone IbpA|tara:strand:+ start:1156 stop:1575 length:420 start_codon:yes stop_codon:yes gene_type:complete
MVIQVPTIHDLQRSWIGADRFFERFASMPTYEDNSYPRFNVTKNGVSYQIEIALAGYKKENITIERVDGRLEIRGEKNLKDVADESYLHRGITRKAFKRGFTISDDVEIDGAAFVDGILTVDLHVEIPEEKRPKNIDID